MLREDDKSGEAQQPGRQAEQQIARERPPGLQ